jgi:LPS export ABC transporter protein LptC
MKKIAKKMIQKVSVFRHSLFYFCVMFCILNASCDISKIDVSKIKRYAGPTIKTYDMQTLLSDSAKIKVKVNAPLQLEYEGGNQDFPQGITVNFFDQKGTNYSRLTANRAKYFKEKDEWVGTGNVIVKNMKKKEELKTEELKWSPKTKQIYTDKFVNIATEKEVLKGTGLEASQDLETYKIKKPTGDFYTTKE